MKLNEISDNVGAKKVRKRVGRGIGSGLGKTAGRGGKGQTARAGGAKAGFEGGQMPIYRRLPKRGFNKPNQVEYNEINLARLQLAIESGKLDAGKPVNLQSLLAAGVITHPGAGIRVLGQGELKTKITVEAHHASKGATAAIEKLGGSVKVLRPTEEEVAAANKKKNTKNAAASK
jgi:large subunit ribosomal protein L15